jgi:uncharacterized protein (DUF427 family)
MKSQTGMEDPHLEGTVITGDRPAGHDSPMLIEPTEKRVRVVFSNTPIADSILVKLLLERNHSPVYYCFPPGGVQDRESCVLRQPTCRYLRGGVKAGGPETQWSR